MHKLKRGAGFFLYSLQYIKWSTKNTTPTKQIQNPIRKS